MTDQRPAFELTELGEAVKACLTPETYAVLVGRLSPPELLKAAAYQCFLHQQAPGVEDLVRAACVFLDQTGVVPTMVKVK